MPRARRKIAFVLAASDHGAMIVNRFDYRLTGNDAGIGVGYQILFLRHIGGRGVAAVA